MELELQWCLVLQGLVPFLLLGRVVKDLPYTAQHSNQVKSCRPQRAGLLLHLRPASSPDMRSIVLVSSQLVLWIVLASPSLKPSPMPATPLSPLASRSSLGQPVALQTCAETPESHGGNVNATQSLDLADFQSPRGDGGLDACFLH